MRVISIIGNFFLSPKTIEDAGLSAPPPTQSKTGRRGEAKQAVKVCRKGWDSGTHPIVHKRHKHTHPHTHTHTHPHTHPHAHPYNLFKKKLFFFSLFSIFFSSKLVHVTKTKKKRKNVLVQAKPKAAIGTMNINKIYFKVAYALSENASYFRKFISFI